VSEHQALLRGEAPAAACGIGLVISMFALKWYGISGRSSSVVGAIDAWRGLTVLSWLMLATALVAVASAALHLGQRGHGAKTDTSLLIAGPGTVTAALVTYRVLIHMPDSHAVVDQKLGALIGLAFALGLAGSGWAYRHEVRRRGRPATHRPRTGRESPEPALTEAGAAP
jgi:hypothetical protein